MEIINYWLDTGSEYEGDPATNLADRLEAAGVLAPEWMSVKERLPEVGVEVLTWCRYSDGSSCHFIDHISKKSGGWWEDGNEAEGFGVTHWQPLPQPPQGD